MNIEPESQPTRRPRNKAEGLFWDAATEAGWTPIKRGWPDFFCWREDGTFCAVEVKPRRDYNLSRHQGRIARALALRGIPTFKWTPDGGFERVETEGL